MSFLEKTTLAILFWFKWSWLFGFLFVASWIGMAIFDSTYYALNLIAQDKQIIYFAIMAIPFVIGIFWFLWSIVYVPVRYYLLGYRYMVETCPACKTYYIHQQCPNCKGTKFLNNQCMVCGLRYDGSMHECQECKTVGMKFKAARFVEFEEKAPDPNNG
jgi:hypothetical protein